MLALAGLVGACSPAVPAGTTESGQSSSTVATAPSTTTMPPTTTTSIPPTPPEVEATFPQTGVSAPIWDDSAYGETQFVSTLSDIAAAGAQWVTFIPTWYQLEETSSTIYAETPGRTTTDAALVAAIREAVALGLEVTLKPHVDLVEGGSRTSIDPAAEDEWFESYTEMISNYARMAESEGVGQFVVGTELGGTSNDATAWREVIAEVREVFSGPVTYAANHDEFENVEFWDALDFIGIDAYFPLAETATSDIAALTAAWQPIVDRIGGVAAEFGRLVVFTEIGYPSQEGATVEPFNPFYSDVASEEEQAAALQAMLDSVRGQAWFGGFHWWMWFVEDSPEEAALGYMPEGKLAGALLEEYWAGE